MAADLNDQIKLQTVIVGLHPGMDPGLYICANDHLHIKGIVTTHPKSYRQGKGSEKTSGADGKLFGTATFSGGRTQTDPVVGSEAVS